MSKFGLLEEGIADIGKTYDEMWRDMADAIDDANNKLNDANDKIRAAEEFNRAATVVNGCIGAGTVPDVDVDAIIADSVGSELSALATKCDSAIEAIRAIKRTCGELVLVTAPGKPTAPAGSSKLTTPAGSAAPVPTHVPVSALTPAPEKHERMRCTYTWRDNGNNSVIDFFWSTEYKRYTVRDTWHTLIVNNPVQDLMLYVNANGDPRMITFEYDNVTGKPTKACVYSYSGKMPELDGVITNFA